MKNKNYSLKLVAIMLMISVIAVACKTAEPVNSSGRIAADYASFVDNLKKEGANVKPSGQVDGSAFSTDGEVINVDGQDVQVYEYQSEAEAEKVAATISKEGSSVGTSLMTWIDEPHFYEKGKIIVTYIGKDEKTISTLEKVLGKQIAGVEKNGQESGTKNKRRIPTEKGNLELSYENSVTTLSGMLSRSTPCVNWTVEIGGTKDLPRSEVTINIYNKNKNVICVQVLGQPQEINAQIENVSENTKYEIKLENEIVFSNELNG